MKKIFTLCAILVFSTSLFAQQFCDDFESYNHGDPIAETSSDWETWGSISAPTPPYADDANVDTAMAANGLNALKFSSSAANGGPEDVVLPFTLGGNPYVAGDFNFTTNFYVQNGSGAYFNFQAENTPGVSWAVDFNLSNGNITVSNGGGATTFLTGTYPQASWFELQVNVDLTNNLWEVLIDSVSLGTFTNTVNQIASLDIYPLQGHTFWLDDVCFNYTAPILTNLNGKVTSLQAVNGLTGQDRSPSVEIINWGKTTITSFDVTYDYNGNQITENVTGVALDSLQSMIVDFTTSINLVSGTNTATATISNVNGASMDSVPADDSKTLDITPIDPAPYKLVIGEEATGTWCGWCPRGAVALNEMDRDYPGYFQGIAVHNGDDMTDADYDSGIGNWVGGYPSGLVDRNPEVDPSQFEDSFLQQITINPSGYMETGASINGDTLNVSLTATFLNNIAGNWKMACVIVEDSVTGTSASYNQANYYSNSIHLVDVDGTDWFDLPSPVPAADMVYRHVARAIAPSFSGQSLPNNNYAANDTHTECFSFILDPSWDTSKIHIVGMLISFNGKIDNGSSASVAEALSHGYTNCATSSAMSELQQVDADYSLYPNPTEGFTQLSLQLDQTTEVSLLIKDTKGQLIAQRNYGQLQGSYHLPLETNKLPAGVYFINISLNGEWKTEKLIIQ